jgi:uncharacterized repeat protein (TIGR03803 family)
VGKLSLWRMICLVGVICVLAVIGSAAQTFTTLVSFNGTDGVFPNGPLAQGFNGNFYGTTPEGGASSACRGSGCGTIFEITPGGMLITLHSFTGHDGHGYGPHGALVQATNGNFYGTTAGGGANNKGTVFEISPGGQLTTLHSFDYADGAQPMAGLVQATNGNLYGTTFYGGANNSSGCNDYGCGTVFEITPGGRLTTLYSFCSQPGCSDGYNLTAGLVQATDGNLYGTTTEGGANGLTSGTVFEITPGGKLTTLYSFGSQPDDGIYPNGLVQATNGNFLGQLTVAGPAPVALALAVARCSKSPPEAC